MSNYKGDLKGFPQEVVEWMLDQQEAQGNRRDVSVFEEGRMADKSEGGFNWGKRENIKFCSEVICYRNFSLFFEKHPKKTPEPEPAQTPDFDEHRFQAACAAMAALIQKPVEVKVFEMAQCIDLPELTHEKPEVIAKLAVAHADALLSALKGGNK
jgi:hypothetical protein